MKNIFRFCLYCLMPALGALTAQAQKDIYEIRKYSLKNDDQIRLTDNFLKNAFLPAMHRLGIKEIGVFKPVSNDTAAIKQILVIIPYISLDVWRRTKLNLITDSVYDRDGSLFLDADTSHLPFIRLETTLLEAFPDQPRLIPPTIKRSQETIYELRSYESPTKVLHTTKVEMFNSGGEIKLFRQLNFQAVFYGDVLSGDRMPNLIYMLVFPSAADRLEKWKAFGESDKWKEISTDPHYRNNISVNHIDSWILQRTMYSDY
jgi:NIPSNAP